jgi:hypothetical protein
MLKRAMKSSLPSVNLLNFNRRNVGTQFIDWALTVGRLLVIITEAVAFCMFAYRFIIDRQLVDLHDYIRIRQPTLVAYAAKEQTFRDLQDRLQTVKVHADDTTHLTSAIQTIVTSGRGLATFQSLKLSGTTITLDGTSVSIGGMKQFLDKLRADNATKDLSIDKVDNDPSTGKIQFSVTITRTSSL